MYGLILWIDQRIGMGIIWCEDQGPLAVLGPDVDLPKIGRPATRGDQVFVALEEREGTRHVREVAWLSPGEPGNDPGAILAAHAPRVPELRGPATVHRFAG